MDFRLTQDQRDLRSGIGALLAGRFDRDRLRAAVDGGGVLDRALWAELSAAGVFSLRVPEAAGGLGLGLAEAVLVFEELGRSLLPGPLAASELAAAVAGSAVAGSAVAGSAVVGDGPGAVVGGGPGRVAALVRLPHRRGPLLVEQASSLDLLLVLDQAAGELRAVDPAELSGVVRAVRGVDPLTPLWEVTGPLPHGTPVPGVDVDRLWTEGTLLTAALQVGLAGRAVDSAVAHAGQREQFGQPIGAFQAVQHLCADMLARLEPARVAVRAAAVALDAADAAASAADRAEATAEAAAEAAGAKLSADEAAVRGARDCLQVHGGMGFTWEADVHLLVKRAWVWQRSFAGLEECAEALSRRLLAGGLV
jgi:alkylation response protein AidB-like acyl-CoA dehydrogenase